MAGQVAPSTEAVPLLRRAVEVADPVPPERARSLLALGEALRRDGERNGARDVLREALDLGPGAGRRLRGPGGRTTSSSPRSPAAGGCAPRATDALTPTERRVATLAADGLTNRAVARALFVSEKTVETHLGAVYRKLGVSARSQLAGAL